MALISGPASTEEHGARARAVDLHVTSGAIPVLLILIVRRPDWLLRAHSVIYAVTRQAQLIDSAVDQQPWICRSVRHVARLATFGLNRCVLINERPLLVGVALNARGVGAGGQPRLL